jgi:hypothetical protein
MRLTPNGVWIGISAPTKWQSIRFTEQPLLLKMVN